MTTDNNDNDNFDPHNHKPERRIVSTFRISISEAAAEDVEYMAEYYGMTKSEMVGSMIDDCRARWKDTDPNRFHNNHKVVDRAALKEIMTALSKEKRLTGADLVERFLPNMSGNELTDKLTAILKELRQTRFCTTDTSGGAGSFTLVYTDPDDDNISSEE